MGFEKLVQGNLITFDVIVNNVVALVFSCVSLIYRKATEFCILIVYDCSGEDSLKTSYTMNTGH